MQGRFNDIGDIIKLQDEVLFRVCCVEIQPDYTKFNSLYWGWVWVGCVGAYERVLKAMIKKVLRTIVSSASS